MKLYLNLCAFRALRPKRSLVNQIPSLPLHRLWYRGCLFFLVSLCLKDNSVGKFLIEVDSVFHSLVVEGKKDL